MLQVNRRWRLQAANSRLQPHWRFRSKRPENKSPLGSPPGCFAVLLSGIAVSNCERFRTERDNQNSAGMRAALVLPGYENIIAMLSQ